MRGIVAGTGVAVPAGKPAPAQARMTGGAWRNQVPVGAEADLVPGPPNRRRSESDRTRR